jgi:hypothetical protein
MPYSNGRGENKSGKKFVLMGDSRFKPHTTFDLNPARYKVARSRF